MADKIDILSFKIAASKMHANGNAYFKLFEKHIPVGYGENSTILLYKIDNMSCIAKIMDMNNSSKYIVVTNDATAAALRIVLNKSINVDYLKDFDFEKNDMKFDCIIMNPPYVRNLHLKILAEAIKHLKDEKSICVNLSPVLWLEDPHAHMKSKSNLFKFDNSIVHKCEQLDVVDKDIANQLFNTGLFANLGIYVCKKNAKGIDSKNFWKRNFEDWEVKVFDKVYALKTHIEDKCENNKRDGIRVPIAFIAGNRGTLPIYKDIAYVVDGMKDGKDWTKCKNNGGYEKEEGIPIPISIKFATEVEAQNFYDSWKTTFCKWLSKRFLFDQNIPLRFLPFLGDAINPRTGLKGYTSEWTDDDLYKLFEISPEEQEEIERTMAKYDPK